MRGLQAPCTSGATSARGPLRPRAHVASSARLASQSCQASPSRPSTTSSLCTAALAAAGGLGRTFQRGGRGGQRRRAAVEVRAAAGSKAVPGTKERIPIFPLSSVALPAAEFPLQIFEARYRVLFSTLLAGDEGIEEGLVSPDKPWLGSRRFGMSFYDPQSQGLATIGTVLRITQHSTMDDGRLLVQSVGAERFKILDVIEERPVMVCEVEYLEEDEATTPEAVALAAEVGEMFRNVVALSTKLKDTTAPEELANPAQLSTLSPREVSFWVASLLAGNPYQQQALLEEDGTVARLQSVREVLSGALKYLGAQSALQSAFKTDGSGSSPFE